MYPRKSVVSWSNYPRKSVVNAGFYHRKSVFLEEIPHFIYSILREKYISNKKARLEYYEFRIVKIEDTYIAVEELQTDISFRSEFR